MAYLLPRAVYQPVRSHPARHHDFIPALFNVFDDTLFDHLDRQAAYSRQRPAFFNPKFDVKEDKDAYHVEGELPGFDPKNVSIEFVDDGHTLQIKGRTETHRESGRRPQALTQAEKPAAIEAAESPSSTASVNSHHATVEDEVDGAGASAVTSTANEGVTSEPATETAVAPVQQEATPEPDVRHWISERSTGEFTRRFNFPSRVDQESVKASLKDGILSVTLPFAKQQASRRINIE